MADVKWIKITTDIFDDEKILLIESMPDANSIIVVWFKLLCLAGKMNNSGVLKMNEYIAYDEKMLATIFRMKEMTVKLALETFEKFGMISKVDGVITIPNWGKHQNLDKLEAKKNYMKNYMSEYREKQKEISCKTNSKTNCKTNSNVYSKTNSKTNCKTNSNVYSKTNSKTNCKTNSNVYSKTNSNTNCNANSKANVRQADIDIDKEEEKERDKEIYNGDSDNEIELFFEEVWEKYPRKNGKGHVRLATKRRLYKEVGLEHMLRCIERYKKYIAEHRITEEYIKYGSSFFNGGYIDYLDENYVAKPKDQVKEEPKPTYFDCYGLAHPTDVQDYARFDRFRNLTKEQIQHFVDKGSFNMETGGLDGLYLTKDEIKLLQEKGVV